MSLIGWILVGMMGGVFAALLIVTGLLFWDYIELKIESIDL